MNSHMCQGLFTIKQSGVSPNSPAILMTFEIHTRVYQFQLSNTVIISTEICYFIGLFSANKFDRIRHVTCDCSPILFVLFDKPGVDSMNV